MSTMGSIGSIFSAFGSANEAMTQWKMGEEQWKLTKRMMGYKLMQSAQEIKHMEEQAEETRGTQATKYAASGVKSEGSPMDVMLATERMGRREIEEKRAWDQIQVWEMRKAGRLAKKAAGYAALGSLFSGIAQFAGSSMGQSMGGYAGSLFKSGDSFKMKSPYSGQYSGVNLLG